MLKYILPIFIFFILSESGHAKIIQDEGEWKHTGDISPNQACKLAEKRAKENAIKQALGLKISLEETEKCKEVDGVLDCEHNQTSILSLNGNITEYKILNKDSGLDELSNIYYCKIKIEAKVEPSFEEDLNFQLDSKLNREDFRHGEQLEIEILSNEEMFLTIYQFFPYEKGYQVLKLFPNEREKNNKISSEAFRLPTESTKYTVEFPKNSSKARVDEHLILIASKTNINWLGKYSTIEDLRKRLIELGKKNIIKGRQQKTYTIFK